MIIQLRINILRNRILVLGIISLLLSCQSKIYDLGDYGVIPDVDENSSPLILKALNEINSNRNVNEKIMVILPKGTYNFFQDGAEIKEYYISNHDQDNPKYVGITFDDMQNITFDGQGSELLFHGRMLPISLVNTKDCTIKNIHIDFPNPHINQVKVLENDTIHGSITFEVAPWVEYEIRNSSFVSKGEGWEHISNSGIAFEGETKRLVYQTSDISVGTRNIEEISPRIIKSHSWNDKRLIPGTVVAMRGHGRPTPGIFISHSQNTSLENVKIHYAEGMGVLAQMSEDITLDGLSVCLRGDNDPRYFTAQADATHFSGCKGVIVSQNGLYEGMMDDAINVHGTYLRITERENDNTLTARYMHDQCYGFDWGYTGDKVQFINSKTMEIVGAENRIESILPVDQPGIKGVKEFKIVFKDPIDESIDGADFGMENLEWTPEVVFRDNIVRNNRARGTLFSTPKATLIENNLFDHTSGTAILLCGDCNGWFETGACKDVIIRNNKFVNSLTNMFQFTNAVISIFPVIPDLENQEKYFHSGIVIENNEFETFDMPIVYAKSVDGLIFKNNAIKQNNSYPAFHWNKHRFLFERVTNSVIENNEFDTGFDKEKDIKNIY